MNIGRNDPCPCGSGKKFKRCCIDNPIAESFYSMDNSPSKIKGQSKLFHFIQKYNSTEQLNLVTALQVIPKNYGKNIRIEIIAKEVIKALNYSQNKLPLKEFRELVWKEYPRHYAEDLPENNFTENVTFFGGNYVVIPGISSNGAEIFRTLIESIFLYPNSLPEQFKSIAYSSISWILELSKPIFEKAGLVRYMFEEDDNHKIEFPNELIDYSFSEEDIDQIARKLKLSREILADFILSSDDPALNSDNPDHNPLLRKPLILHDQRLFFVLPSAQLSALNEYLLVKARELNCSAELLDTYNKLIWMLINERLKEMGWVITNVVLPENKEHTNLNELICQIDDNKLAYVCFVKAKTEGKHEGAGEMYNDIASMLGKSGGFNERLSAVIKYLKSKPEFEGNEFLTLVIIGDVGRNGMFMVNKPAEREERIWFSAFEFLHLAVCEDWDMLSIWRFAKVLRMTSTETSIYSTSTLDSYWLYKNNEGSFYGSDDARYDTLTIVPGTGAELARESIKKQDVHGAPIDKDGVIGYYLVKRAFQPAPVYKPIERTSSIERLLEGFSFPLWFYNDQIADNSVSEIFYSFINAIAFWLHKLRPSLKEFDLLGSRPFYVKLILDEQYLTPKHGSDISEEGSDVKFNYTLIDRTIEFNVPYSLTSVMHSPTNAGERLMMQNILKAFTLNKEIQLSDEDIQNMLDRFIPLGPAKMILFMDTARDIRVDPRWLLNNRFVSDAEISLVLDELKSFITEPNPIPKKVVGRENKVKLCNDIVKGLILKLRKKLSTFNSADLLKRLILIHEGYVQQREYQKIHIPAKIACFSGMEEEIEKVIKKDNQLVDSTIAIRCLIEFIAADPQLAGQLSSFSDIDEMLALMNSIVNWGSLSDAIHFQLDDTDIGLLPSGRIGTDRDFYNNKLKPFGQARAITEIEGYVESFSRRFGKKEVAERIENKKLDDFNKRVDDAFTADWGIPLSGVLAICYVLTVLAEQNNNSVCEMSSDNLIMSLQTHTKLPLKYIMCGLEKLTLTKRFNFNKAPKGYDQDDIYPWKYNREFAFLRRPLILLEDTSGKGMYYWGWRNSHAVGFQIQNVLDSGRLKTYNQPNIERILGDINAENGKSFRQEVKEWFKIQANFTTVEYEVSIKPQGHIEADQDLGDVDVFTVDQQNKIIYIIECKNTEQAKNIHEMKSEIDKYIGKNPGEGLIQKHVKRDHHLQVYPERARAIVHQTDDFKIVSIILTSEDLPLSYIKRTLPLPLISFPQLKRGGLASLIALGDSNTSKM